MTPALLESLKKDLKPVKPLRPAWQIALFAFLLCAGVSVALGMWMVPYGLDSLTPKAWMILNTAFLLGLGACAWTAAQWMSPTGKGALLPIAFAWVLGVVGLWMGSEPDDFQLEAAMTCFQIGSLAALLPAVALLAILRRSAPMLAHRVALSAGFLAGFSGFVVIQLHCPKNDFWHMFTGHALLPFVWGLTAYLCARLIFHFAERRRA